MNIFNIKRAGTEENVLFKYNNTCRDSNELYEIQFVCTTKVLKTTKHLVLFKIEVTKI